MWRDQTPRQIFELLKSYKDLHDDSKAENDKPRYTVKSKNLKIPGWLKDRIPDGATVYHADDVCQGDI